MVLCRYFQQGTCRFGQNCRFEHASQQYGGSTVSPLLRQATQATQPPQPAAAIRNTLVNNNPFRPVPKKDANDIFNLMVQDINEAEKGGVWPLSCYNFWPAISLGNVPGLEDLSPDEMRHLQLQAQAAGNLEACMQQIQQMYQQARNRFNSLKTRTPETLAIIESMTRGPSQPAAQSSSQFSFARGNNVVHDSWPASPTSQTSIFGGSSAPASNQGQSSIFGGSSSPASNQGQSSIFGGSTGFGSNQGSVFSAANTFAANQGSVFGGTTGQQSVFGGASPQKSVFGGASQQPTQTTFAGSQQSSIFGGASSVQQSSPFGAAAAVQPAAPFISAPNVGQSGGSIFGGASVATAQPSSFSFALPNTFGASATAPQGVATASFGVPAQPSTNVFAAAAAVQNTAPPSSNIFGGSAAQGSNVVLNSTIYTAMAQLTESERREFEAETFSVGNIPTRPPPRELC